MLGMILLTTALLSALGHCASFDDGVIRGTGDTELLQLISYARRSLGEVSTSTTAEWQYQSLPMLYSGTEDGLLEGPTWGAYWTQNSYGTAMTTLPFLSDVAFKGMKESQNWWFNNMADGTNPYAGGSQGWAPDGCGCDNGEPTGCNYKQGDGNVPIHDWTLEETLSGVVMQAELLLISRNTSAIAEFLPKALRTSNLIEGRRDPASGMTAFLSGPSSNLLAPSFGGWILDNGRHAWSWMTGIVVTYSAALLRLVQLARLVGDTGTEQLYEERLAMNLKGLDQFLDPSSRSYFVRSIDPNGTLHGVIGASRHGYFEASPNHDAVALGVVNMTIARRIINKIQSLGSLIRPNVFILPNTDANGKPSVAGAGGVGYDDMACGSGATCGGIFEFGTWVNGGVWTTTEGRWLMASARVGDIEPAFASVRQMLASYGRTWRMDNPLVDFGQAPYQPDEDINLTVDNFASAGGLLRGLFEYAYTATDLTLRPHQPDNITSFEQLFGARWGPYKIFVQTRGVCSSGIASVLLNGRNLTAPHSFNGSSLTLVFEGLPPPSASAAASVNSTFRSGYTALQIQVMFAQRELHQQQQHNRTSLQSSSLFSSHQGWPLDPPHACEALQAAHGPSSTAVTQMQRFINTTASDPNLTSTLAHSMAKLSIGYLNGFQQRCAGLNNGTVTPLRSFNASEASLVQLLSTSVSMLTGLLNHLSTSVTRATGSDALAVQLLQAWGPLYDVDPEPPQYVAHARYSRKNTNNQGEKLAPQMDVV